ncbi:MAG: hypothetical protein J5I50_02780 [Chitinophagaceae bacterium]|nr:hypothetical protein [Chitinophagaceae bacterium]
MKFSYKSIITLLLTFISFYGYAQQDWDITGVWTGTLYNDSTQKYIPFELAVTRHGGDLSGYTYTVFMIDSIPNIGVKEITVKEKNELYTVRDKKLIDNNYTEAPDKGVYTTLELSHSQNDTADVLSGRWYTNRTKYFYPVGGAAFLTKKLRVRETNIVPRLEKLGLAGRLSFLQSNRTGDIATVDKKKLKAKKSGEPDKESSEPMMAVMEPGLVIVVPKKDTAKQIKLPEISELAQIAGAEENTTREKNTKPAGNIRQQTTESTLAKKEIADNNTPGNGAVNNVAEKSPITKKEAESGGMAGRESRKETQSAVTVTIAASNAPAKDLDNNIAQANQKASADAEKQNNNTAGTDNKSPTQQQVTMKGNVVDNKAVAENKTFASGTNQNPVIASTDNKAGLPQQNAAASEVSGNNNQKLNNISTAAQDKRGNIAGEREDNKVAQSQQKTETTALASGEQKSNNKVAVAGDGTGATIAGSNNPPTANQQKTGSKEITVADKAGLNKEASNKIAQNKNPESQASDVSTTDTRSYSQNSALASAATNQPVSQNAAQAVSAANSRTASAQKSIVKASDVISAEKAVQSGTNDATKEINTANNTISANTAVSNKNMQTSETTKNQTSQGTEKETSVPEVRNAQGNKNTVTQSASGTAGVKQQETTKTAEVVKKAPAPAPDLSKRKIETIQTVQLRSDSIVLSLYDNGIVDGDTVSVLLNGQVLLSRIGLKEEAFNHTLHITPEMSDSLNLVMYAENLGSIPPNSGLLIVRDKGQTYEIRFSGDLQKNSAIILLRNKQDEDSRK